MKLVTQYKYFFILFLIVFLFNLVFSDQSTGIVRCQTAEECNWQEFVDTTGRLISYIVIISYWIAFSLVVVGSFLVMFHGPKVELYKKGVDIIKIAIFGYILILLSGVIFDAILEFFEPKFKESSENNFYLTFFNIFLPKVYADDYKSSQFTLWYRDVKEDVATSLKCGENASTTLGRLFKCAFETVNSLKSLALILLGLAIIISAAYIISVPLFGLKNIPRAYQILIWSIIGLIVILLADVIKSQIEKLTK
jgi:hypothetical protein